MNHTQIIKTLINQKLNSEPAALSFQPGQILSGKITKLFPNQTAEVQIGAQKVIAQLETALSVNDRYWFQVQPGEGKIHLKVLNQLSNAGALDNSAAMILAQLGLQSTKENEVLIKFMIKNRLPVVKESLQQASQFMKSVELTSDGLATIKMMTEKGLPFTKDIFSSLLSLQQKEPVHQLMGNLKAVMPSKPATATEGKLLQMLTEFTTPASEKLGLSVLRFAMEEWLSSKSAIESPALKLLRASGIIQMDDTEAAILGRLASHQKASRHFEKPDSSFVVTPALPGNSNEKSTAAPVYREAGLNLLKELSAPVSSATQMMNRSEAAMNLLSLMGVSDHVIKDGIKTLGRMAAMKVDQERGNIFTSTNQVESQVLEDAVRNLKETAINWSNGSAVKDELKRLVSSMGFDYEIELASHVGIQKEENIDSLKPLLIRYLNDSIQPSTREAAEQLLNKITGVQLLAQEAGPIQQMVMQMPVAFLEKTFDLTMQWSGKKKEDGKIDSDYCRVLFYLELENIGHTIVDMQVQNRIISLSIVNGNHNLKSIASPMIQPLRESLREMDYHLSSVSINQPSNQGEEKPAKEKHTPKYEHNLYTGVDIKV